MSQATSTRRRSRSASFASSTRAASIPVDDARRCGRSRRAELQRFGATFTPIVAGPFTTTRRHLPRRRSRSRIGPITLTRLTRSRSMSGAAAARGDGAVAARGALVLVARGRPARLAVGRAARAGAGAVVTRAVASSSRLRRRAPTSRSRASTRCRRSRTTCSPSSRRRSARPTRGRPGSRCHYARDPLVSTITSCGSDVPDMVTVGQTAMPGEAADHGRASAAPTRSRTASRSG